MADMVILFAQPPSQNLKNKKMFIHKNDIIRFLQGGKLKIIYDHEKNCFTNTHSLDFA